jgi:hypothetical protein
VNDVINDVREQWRPAPVDPDTHEKCRTYKECEAILSSYGIDLKNSDVIGVLIWTWEELAEIVYGIQKLMYVADWTVEAFKWAMGISDTDRSTRLTFVRSLGCGELSAAACTNGRHEIWFTASAFDGSTGRRGAAAAVHELAHIWDLTQEARGQGYLSTQYMEATGGHEERQCVVILCREPRYVPGGDPVSERGKKNQFEDFAESVAAYVFPDEPDFVARTQTKDWKNGARREFVKRRFQDYQSARVWIPPYCTPC